MSSTEQDIARHLNGANQARSAGQPDVAKRHLMEALRIAPTDPRVLNAAGMQALADKDYIAAVAHFEAAAAADPTAGALLLNLATAHRGSGHDAGEAAALQRAISLNQLDFMAQLRMAELRQRTGETKAAAIHWSAVVQLATGMQEPPPLVKDAHQRGTAFLLEHNQAIGARVDAKLGQRLAELGPDARRVHACIDHSLGSRQIYTNRCEGLHVPFLPADEFFDRRLFPWLAGVEAKTAAIRAEALDLLQNGSDAIRPYVRQADGTPANKWSPLDNSLNWGACFLWEYGERNQAVCERCPETAAALALAPQNIVPGKAPTAFFSILQPRAHIPAHTGVTNSRAIIHLPLVVPDGCRFRVGGETRHWVEGEAFAFDDTIDHEAWNDSDETRIVLIFDVWNPHLTEAECAIIADYLSLTDAG
jgi:aspartate beta-hydroxylase